LFWIVDGYTTSDSYPYAQGVSTDSVAGDLSGGYNYVRNSVKAVVDAYNGTIELYVIDESDPVLEAWVSAFPELFVDGAAMPESLRDNLRYPEDLFAVQTDMWSDYVIADPGQLIVGDLAWSVAGQPRTEAQVGEEAPSTVGASMAPQYLITRLPGSSEPEFVLQRAFVPRSVQAGSNTGRPELTGVMMARSDPGSYGELVLFKIPSGQVEAPDFVHSEIRKNDDLTEFVKDKIGSLVSFGDMTLLLVDDTILYIRPVYVQAASATAVPELAKVIAVNGDRIAMGDTLEEAVRAVATGPPVAEEPETGESADTGTEADDPPVVAEADPEDDVEEVPAATDDPPDGSTVDDPVDDYDPTGKSVIELLADAEELLRSADEAEANGQVEVAAGLRADAHEAVPAMQALLGGPPSGAPTTAGAGATGT
jgi:uncharacterized membrane protein (UPF0182 family)